MELAHTFLDDPGIHWAMAVTVPRCEQALAQRLNSHGIPTYLPLHRVVTFVVRKHGGARERRQERLLPLLDCYLAFADSDEAREAMIGRQGRRELLWGDRPILTVPLQDEFRRECRAIENALAENPELSGASPINAGTRCRIIAGPYMGMACIVDRLPEPTRGREVQRAVVLLTTMGRAMELDLFRDQLEPVTESEAA